MVEILPGRQLKDGVVRAESKESAVGQHKDDMGKTEPGDGDSGHGSFESSRTITQ